MLVIMAYLDTDYILCLDIGHEGYEGKTNGQKGYERKTTYLDISQKGYAGKTTYLDICYDRPLL